MKKAPVLVGAVTIPGTDRTYFVDRMSFGCVNVYSFDGGPLLMSLYERVSALERDDLAWILRQLPTM